MASVTSDNSLEQRVANLEAAMAKISKQSDFKHWWQGIDGIMKDCPAFPEVVELGREIRSGRMEVPGLEP
jgi:hypothetical protein